MDRWLCSDDGVRYYLTYICCSLQDPKNWKVLSRFRCLLTHLYKYPGHKELTCISASSQLERVLGCPYFLHKSHLGLETQVWVLVQLWEDRFRDRHLARSCGVRVRFQPNGKSTQALLTLPYELQSHRKKGLCLPPNGICWSAELSSEELWTVHCPLSRTPSRPLSNPGWRETLQLQPGPSDSWKKGVLMCYCKWTVWIIHGTPPGLRILGEKAAPLLPSYHPTRSQSWKPNEHF